MGHLDLARISSWISSLLGLTKAPISRSVTRDEGNIDSARVSGGGSSSWSRIFSKKASFSPPCKLQIYQLFIAAVPIDFPPGRYRPHAERSHVGPSRCGLGTQLPYSLYLKAAHITEPKRATTPAVRDRRIRCAPSGAFGEFIFRPRGSSAGGVKAFAE